MSGAHTMPIEHRHELQKGRLMALVDRLRNLESDYWRAKLSDVDLGRVAAGEMAALPFTTKAEMRDAYPFGMLAVPLSEVGPPGHIPRQEIGKAKRVFSRTDHEDPFPRP